MSDDLRERNTSPEGTDVRPGDGSGPTTPARVPDSPDRPRPEVIPKNASG